MGIEKIHEHADREAEVIMFPNQPTLLHELNVRTLGDIELERIIEQQVSRQEILRYEDRDERVRFVLNAVLEGIGVTKNVEDLFDPDTGELPLEHRSDAEHILSIEEKVKEAYEWYDWYVEEYGRLEAGDRLLEMQTMVSAEWSHTDLYRAFSLLQQRTSVNRTDQQAHAVITAHRMALIMMAQATPGYTIASER